MNRELTAEEKRVLMAWKAAEPFAKQIALEMLENHPAQKPRQKPHIEQHGNLVKVRWTDGSDSDGQEGAF